MKPGQGKPARNRQVGLPEGGRTGTGCLHHPAAPQGSPSPALFSLKDTLQALSSAQAQKTVDKRLTAIVRLLPRSSKQMRNATIGTAHIPRMRSQEAASPFTGGQSWEAHGPGQGPELG